jgi:hypothetical protein
MQQFPCTADLVIVEGAIPTSLQPSGQPSHVERLVLERLLCAPDEALHKKVCRYVCKYADMYVGTSRPSVNDSFLCK